LEANLILSPHFMTAAVHRKKIRVYNHVTVGKMLLEEVNKETKDSPVWGASCGDSTD